MNIKTITVNLGCKLSPRSYNNVEAHVGMTAELSEGEEVEVALAQLGEQARATLAAEVGHLLAPLPRYVREPALEMVGVHAPPQSDDEDTILKMEASDDHFYDGDDFEDDFEEEQEMDEADALAEANALESEDEEDEEHVF